AIVFVQWFSSALLLYPHLHVLIPDGVFTSEGEEVAFHPIPAPDDEEVEKILKRTAHKVIEAARSHLPEGLPFPEDAHAAQMVQSVQTRLPIAEEYLEKRS